MRAVCGWILLERAGDCHVQRVRRRLRDGRGERQYRVLGLRGGQCGRGGVDRVRHVRGRSLHG